MIAMLGIAMFPIQDYEIWQENRNRDAARGDGEQENGIGQENRKRDAARGTGDRRTGSGRRTGNGTQRGGRGTGERDLAGEQVITQGVN